MTTTKRPASQAVYQLPLTDAGAPAVPGTYIYLPPPTDPAYVVRFQIEGCSSICHRGSLWVNIPAKGEKFSRSHYREYKLSPDFNGNTEIDIPIYEANAYSFYTTYTPLSQWSFAETPESKPTHTPTYYIDVCPRLTLQGKQVPVDSIIVFSTLSKFMGSFPTDWDNHLRGISQRGYNMVHFTPLTIRGESNSPYSIYDQLQFDESSFPNGEKDVARMVKKMHEEFHMLAMTDVVWNHTANNSKWLQDHPEAGYSVETSPWLRPALDLDTALVKFGKDLRVLGLPTKLTTVEDLLKIMDGVKTRVLGGCKLWEYYVINVERDTEAIVAAWVAGEAEFPENGFEPQGMQGLDEVKEWPLKLKADWLVEYALRGGDRMGERFRRRMKPSVGAALLSAIFGRFDSRTSSTPDQRAAHGAIYRMLEEVNLQFYREYDRDAAEIMEQLFNRIKYVRLDEHGPKMGEITDANPLIEPYFTRLPLNETTKKHNQEALALVNNGWVWAADAMKDNAGWKSRAYLKREVIVWGDCVKLRYGDGPQDNPFLWQHMAKYTRLMAKYFQGFRIDNCHSTPIHLAEYMLDQARSVNPNIFVCAELFSGSEEMDFKFVMRLGLSALIRECMQAWSTQELSRLVHRHGGIPIGSFSTDEVLNADKSGEGANGQTFGKREVIHKIKRSPVHALFMDCTHDNETPAEKRDARDTLPSAALVAMCACATGSVMGFDEVYPKIVDLVHEKRLYSSVNSTGGPVKPQAGEGGIGGIKKILNEIHVEMGNEAYTETYIHHDNEYITVHRVQPQTREGYFLIAHTAFPGYGNGNGGFGPTKLPGTKAKLIGSWNLEVDNTPETRAATIGDKKLLRGLPSQTKELRDIIIESTGDTTNIRIPDEFPPGSIALFKTWVPSAEHSEGLDTFVTTGARAAFKDVDLADLNMILYRCDPEERDESNNKDGTYDIPGHGQLVYAGLQGWWSVLRDIVNENNLGHPLCNHLREGQWALDYCIGRLERLAQKKKYHRIQPVAKWMKERFDAIRKIPSYLLPRSFAMVMQTAYNAAVDRNLELMSENMRTGQQFLKSLALVSTQVTGYMNSASLWPDKSVPSMAAGLPHFASDWARCWGRDICISARGLYMCTGRYADAREHILAFASVLKHGMIPNLLGAGKTPRYNSRDSIWWFLQNIQDYTNIVPDGLDILQDKARRRFLPYDDTWFPHDDKRAYSTSSTVEDVIQEALQRHASGMDFREYNAGPDIDSQMKSEGFDLKIWTDWETGLIFGGNQHNCGTWMDKMGESEKAGSKGVPGTPRDGAAVEITGLLYSCLRWVSQLYENGNYEYEGVTLDGDESITFKAWADKIQANFERCYYVPRSPEQDANYDVNSKIVNRRGIYKDLYRSGKEYEDYQLRPNFPVAMTVAPDLFDPEHALFALQQADRILMGPVGMKTLDPSDYNYRGYYVNSEDSTDFHTSKGRNYHQGPEWTWPRGYFLRALLKFDLTRRKTQEERVESYQQVTRRLAECMKAIQESPWAGLTELTQKDGDFCGDSCPTQSWSAGCLIDLFQDAREYELAESE
ncbi:glucanotransferase domain of glycogen debranching enzyme-domain-containing protein [Clohesyomyces aquaticus]|uniref:Glycogen debranching enzyme n=1 Tax=Clohesyomyces aquaticus TaxID=1231657 RepID=A0A1Y1ZGC1_9PLEO|nr:glucanotransferase domain of glycogen debranching enzyme-domain-containing protein [Clohesyomyces aquaticus]